MVTWLILLTIGIPWLGALAVWVVSDDHPKAQHTLAVIVSILAGAAALALLPLATDSAALVLPIGGIFGRFTFVPDGLAVFLTVVATVIGSLAVIFSVDYMRGEAQLGRYYTFILLFIGAMAGLALSGSLLLLFFFWEITALCSYALISFYNDDPKAVAGGMKALIITQLGGVGLFGAALAAYAFFGDGQVSTFLAQAGTLPAGVLSLMGYGFLAAAAAKSAQVPFHTWLPGAMEAPTPVSALIHAATMVNAGVYLLARFYPAFEGVPGWKTAVVVVGMVTALLSALMALTANDLKRVLAYSTVSQLGYMVYAVGNGAIFAASFHLLSHAIFKALLFLAAGAVIHAVGTRDMRQMGGLGKQMPFNRAVFIIGSLALAGLPFLNGFWSKELILETGLAGGPVWAYVVMVFVAGLTALYTFRLVWMVFYGELKSPAHVHDASLAMGISLALLALGTLISWLFAGPFGAMLEETLPAHHLHVLPTWELAAEVVTAPATLVALAVVALGLGAWVWRDALSGFTKRLGGVRRLAEADFGFEWLNARVVDAAQQAGETLRGTQTGLLNWNMVGIVGGLLVLLLLLGWGR